MKKAFAIGFIFFASCNNSNTHTLWNPDSIAQTNITQQPDTAKGYTVHCKEDDVCVPVTKEDIDKVENAILRDTALVNEHEINIWRKNVPADSSYRNKEIAKKQFVIAHLSEYKHQYIASPNFKSETIIEVNGILDSFFKNETEKENFKKQWVYIGAGGTKFWHLYYNVNQDKITDWDIMWDEPKK